MVDLAISIGRGDFYRNNNLRYRTETTSRLGSASSGWRRTAASLTANISVLQNVIGSAIGGLRNARSNIAISWFHCREHMIGIGPDHHDLVNTHAAMADGEVFSCPYGAAIAIAGGSQPPADVANMPRHIISRHGRRRGLSKRVNNGVLDERRQPI